MINVMTKLKELKKRITAKGWESIEDWNYVLDQESRSRYIQKIMKEDQVDYDEAWRLVREEPKYSMGYKMCSPAIVMMLRMRGGKETFRSMLTPEELQVFDDEVDGKVNFKKAIKTEFKRQKVRR